MSQFQPQQLQQPQPLPQQQQQPVLVYPNNVNKPPPSHHSNGSFGSVFIVLAVIVVISGIACFLGRLCNRDRSHKSKHNKQSKNKGNNKAHPKEGHHGDHVEFGSQHFRPKEGTDIEIGFDKRIPSGKPSGPNYTSRESRAGSGVINHNKPFVNLHHNDMKLGEMKPGGGGGGHVVIGEPRARG
ncbi:hypothetical protein RchiOBHm_Chr4g0443731 [Rosa chinensis]|uniref:Transmembrane protein n=1 Tax=Rosa chinensis TaxID=74649 RepID=A0A2P6R3Y2_ROSCH|nr:uncharacterized protein LOC112200210 [Rosa chinensis]PRQ41143.1 hypothetical protein RchiOBHm_Chr4g0443731 [Rosa chinensis]